MPPPTETRSSSGSPATPTATWPSPPAPPAPTSSTSTSTAPPETATPAFGRLCAAGLANRAAAWVRTPSGGMHAYFAGSDQRSGRLPGHHLDFRSQGGYVLAPPSQIGGRPYQLTLISDHREGLDWAAVTRLLEPQHQPGHPGQRPSPGPRPQPPGPLGRRPAPGQPQLRPVLGRQPRPGRRLRRRPQPPGRRRPPGRPRRPRDHPHPRLRPQDIPGPAPGRDGGLT